ncbi:uncharacterized protein LOC144620319 [Crassostrea virginica]
MEQSKTSRASRKNIKSPTRCFSLPSRRKKYSIQGYRRDSTIQAVDGNCITCTEKIRVSSLEEIEPGDHVVFHRLGYEHHGIVIEKDENSFWIIEASKPSGKWKILIEKNRKVFAECDRNISVIHYRKRYSKSETIARATAKYNEFRQTNKYNYHVFLNNCEHFASYCATGRECSMQVNKLVKNINPRSLIRYVRVNMLGFDLFDYDDKLFKNLICDDCLALIKSIFSVDRISIRKNEDIEKGDIICCEKLQDAVVLNVFERTDLHARCLIARNEQFGRKIETTAIKIDWNGQYCKLNYTSPTYDVYDPDEVFQRAFRVIDQKSSKNPIDFAKWCKLRFELENWSPS